MQARLPASAVFIFLRICLISFFSESCRFPLAHRLAPENTVLFPLFQMPSKGGLQMSRKLVGLLSKKKKKETVGRIFQYPYPSPTAAKQEGRSRSFRLMNFHRSRILDLGTPNLKELHFNKVLTWLECIPHSCGQCLNQSFMCVPPEHTQPQEGNRSEILKIKIYTSLLNAKNPSWDMPRSGYIHFK